MPSASRRGEGRVLLRLPSSRCTAMFGRCPRTKPPLLRHRRAAAAPARTATMSSPSSSTLGFFWFRYCTLGTLAQMAQRSLPKSLRDLDLEIDDVFDCGSDYIMTNGVFKSPVHRVLTNSKRERISVAMFYTPEPNKEIGPEQGLVNEQQPKVFKKVKDYVDTHWKYYRQGMRALHEAKV